MCVLERGKHLHANFELYRINSNNLMFFSNYVWRDDYGSSIGLPV